MTAPLGTPGPDRVREALTALDAARRALANAGLTIRAQRIQHDVDELEHMLASDHRVAEQIVITLKGDYSADDLIACVGDAARIRDADLRAFVERRLLRATSSALVGCAAGE